MTLKSSLLFAKTLILPKTEKKSTARKSVISSIICIALSIIPLVIVLTMTNSMISGMTERIIEVSSSHLNVFIRRKSRVISSLEKFTEFADKFYSIDGITDVKKEISLEALASSSNFRTGCQIRAVEFEKFFADKKITSLLKFSEGALDFSSINEKTALIGSGIAEKLNLKPGDIFRIITTKKNVNGNLIPNVSDFKVQAVVSSGYNEIDSLWIFIPLESGFSLFSPESALYSVMLKTEDAFSPELNRILNDCSSFSYSDAAVYSWKVLNQSKFENFQSTKIMLYFVMILIVLVASINISAALVMLVMERRKEIAILKSLGASGKSVSFSFVVAGLFCSVAGLFTGLPLGLLCSVNLNEIISFFEKVLNFVIRFFHKIQGKEVLEEYVHLLDPAFYLTEIPIEIPFKEILLSSLFMILLSIIVSLIPALKAGKEKPLNIFSNN